MAINAETLNIVLNAQTKDLRQQLDKAERRIKHFESKTKGDLGRTSKHFDMLGSAAKRLVPILATAFGVQAAMSITRTASEMSKLADIAGLGVVEFQKFAAGARTTGIDMSKASDIIKDVNDKIGDFLTTGAGPMADFFETIAPKVGVTAEQFARLSGPDALQLYVSSLEKANVTQSQMTFFMEALASDATALIPLLKNNGEQMRFLGDEAERSGRIMSEGAVASARQLAEEAYLAGEALRTALLEVFVELAPILIPIAQGISQVAQAVGNLFEESNQPAPLVKLFTDMEQMKQLLGEGVLPDTLVTDEQKAQIQGLSEDYDDLKSMIQDLESETSSYLSTLNNSANLQNVNRNAVNAVRGEFRGLLADIDALNSMFDEEGVTLDQIVVKLQEIVAKASDAQTSMQQLDGLSFENVSLGLEGIIGVLRRVGGTAAAVRNLMPGADRSSAFMGEGDTSQAQDGTQFMDLGTIPAATYPTAPSGGGKDPFADLKARLEEVREYLDEYRMSETEAQIAEFEARQQVLEEALNKELLTQEEFNRLKEENQREHSQKIADIVAAERSVRLGEMSSMFSALADIAEHGGKKAVKAQAILSAAATMIAAYENAVTAAAKAQTIPGKIAAYAGFLAQGLAAVKQIQSIGNSARATSGGGGGGGGAGAAAAPQVSRNVAIQLTGGDMYSRDQVIQLINGINEAVEDGAVVRLV